MGDVNRPIEQLLKSVVTAVKAGSRSQQEPWMEGSIEGEFCFGDCKKIVIASAPEMTEIQREDMFWSDSKAAGNKDGFDAYLESYPRGRYVGLAKALIARLTTGPANPVSQPFTHSTTPANLGATQSPQLQLVTAAKDCAECPEMVAIPTGSFVMGSQDGPISEQPEHRVSVRAFSISKYEITQAQWSAMMGSNPSRFKGPALPVENVSWDDVKEYLRRLNAKTGKNYRLPTEAEWEYAARAGSQTKYSFGDDEARLTQYGWYESNSSKQSQPVGEKLPNAFGLHDMHGNVSEWTEDFWNESYNGASPSDGRAWMSGESRQRVVRGGSWSFGLRSQRSAARGWYKTTYFSDDLGFRVVRTN
jgi:formylglycine-generating enzyme required for sulfatase activity